jgi:ERCC4-related helicase
MDLLRWKQDLEEDQELLSDMIHEARNITVTRDAKLKDLKDLISDKIQNPINADNKKIILFSSFADTAKYLYQHISLFAQKEY